MVRGAGVPVTGGGVCREISELTNWGINALRHVLRSISKPAEQVYLEHLRAHRHI